ncbi:tetratricopeptide repeat protein [Sphingomonas sp.]|uniref:tetratricopeptide repeat protein n=1 Tax=Sphingomonas sp. TaxID=28214 RepID=UPI0035BC2C6A
MLALAAALVTARRAARPDPQVLAAKASATLAAGNYDAARSYARAAIAAGAPGSTPHLVLARADLMLDDGLAAEAELDRAVATGTPAASLHALRAHARLLQGDPHAAAVEAARAAPRDAAYAARIRARSLAAAGDPAAARVALGTLVATVPGDAAAWTDLARLQLTAGDVGGAAQAAARALGISRRDPVTLTLAGEVVRTRFGLVAALPWFEAALVRDPYFHPALIEYAATLGDLGRYTAMLAATRKALAARPGSPQALYLQAVLAARGDRTDLARRILQLTGGAIDGVPGVLLLSGALDYRRGDTDQAVATWRRLVDAQPMNMVARRLLALALLRSGDARGSLDILRPMVLRADADGYTLRLAAHALERVGERAGAAVLLDRAASGGGDAVPFAADTAVGALAAAAADAPGDPTYQIGLIRGLIGSGDPAGAIAKAQELVAAGPGAPAAQVALGDALVAGGRRREAAAVYARAADLAFDAPTVLRLVDALASAQPRQAAAALSLYVAQNPRSVPARRILGHWQVVAGDAGAAVATLESVRRVTGNRDAALLTDLATAYAGRGDGATARAYASAAYAVAPMRGDVIRAYAAALVAAGDRAGARQLAAKARVLGGGAAVR